MHGSCRATVNVFPAKFSSHVPKPGWWASSSGVHLSSLLETKLCSRWVQLSTYKGFDEVYGQKGTREAVNLLYCVRFVVMVHVCISGTPGINWGSYILRSNSALINSNLSMCWYFSSGFNGLPLFFGEKSKDHLNFTCWEAGWVRNKGTFR